MTEIGEAGRGSFSWPPFDLDSVDKDVFLDLIQQSSRGDEVGLRLKINGQRCKIVSSAINIEVKNKKAKNTIQYTLRPLGKTPPNIIYDAPKIKDLPATVKPTVTTIVAKIDQKPIKFHDIRHPHLPNPRKRC